MDILQSLLSSYEIGMASVLEIPPPLKLDDLINTFGREMYIAMCMEMRNDIHRIYMECYAKRIKRKLEERLEQSLEAFFRQGKEREYGTKRPGGRDSQEEEDNDLDPKKPKMEMENC